jgi:malate synthase
VQYIAAWLGGLGAVPLYNLMEDAATAEISRAQVWQWIHHQRGVLQDGRKVDVPLFRTLMEQEMGELRAGKGQLRYDPQHLETAAELFDRLSTADTFADFLTTPAYEYLP